MHAPDCSCCPPAWDTHNNARTAHVNNTVDPILVILFSYSLFVCLLFLCQNCFFYVWCDYCVENQESGMTSVFRDDVTLQTSDVMTDQSSWPWHVHSNRMILIVIWRNGWSRFPKRKRTYMISLTVFMHRCRWQLLFHSQHFSATVSFSFYIQVQTQKERNISIIK